MLELVKRFLKVTGIHPETFGRLVLNDADLVYRLKAGEKLDKTERRLIIDFIQNYEDIKS